MVRTASQKCRKGSTLLRSGANRKQAMEGTIAMERFNRLLIVLPVLLLVPLPCCAQSTGQPDLPSPRPAESSAIPAQKQGATEQVPTPIPLELPAKPSQLSPLEVPPPNQGEVVKLPLPPTEPGDLRFPINLATALRLSDARPLIVAAAQASAWVAEAKLQEAWTLWLPDLNLGFDYIRHDGNGPDTLRGVNIPGGENALGQNSPGSFGRPQNQNINFFYAGGALFYLQYLTDDIFQPLAARQKLNSARWNIQTAKNDALLATALAYFDVHKWRGGYAGAIDVVIKARKLVEEINDLSRDLVPAFEVDRARNFLANMEQHALI